MKWSKQELALLNELRFEKPYTPFAQCPQKFKEILAVERSQDAIRNMANKVRNDEKYEEMDSDVVGVFDIETSDLNADVGYMLGWAVYYPQEDKVVSDFISKKNIADYTLDKDICKSLVKEMEKIDLILGYYSTGFDIPFSRTRCLMNGVAYPGYGSMRHIDVYYFARGKVKTRRKSMGVIADALGLQAKTSEPLSVWNKARLGDAKSLSKIRSYNENDTIVTWKIYQELLKYGRYHSKSI